MESTSNNKEIIKKVSSAGEHLINIALYHMGIIGLSVINFGLYYTSEEIEDYIFMKVILGILIIYCIIMTIAELWKAGDQLTALSKRNDNSDELTKFAQKMEKSKKEFEEAIELEKKEK